MDRAPEVAPHDVSEEDAVLDGERAVEAEVVPHPLHLGDGRVRGQEERDGIPRQPHDHEDHGGDEPEGDERPQQPVGEEAAEAAHAAGAPALAGSRGRPRRSGGRRRPSDSELYVRFIRKLNFRTSSCWFGFGVNSTYLWRP